MAAVIRPVPGTPTRHPNREFERLIDQLNLDYGLGIEVPDHTLSPCRRRSLVRSEAEERVDAICRRLRYQFHQRKNGTLDRILGDFDRAAKDASRAWVKKPNADPDTIPDTGQPPRATTIRQMEELQRLMHGLLERENPSIPGPRLFSRAKSGPAALQGYAAPRPPSPDLDFEPMETSPSRVSAKRGSGQGVNGGATPLKRAKAQHAPEVPRRHASRGLDNVPSRTRVSGATALTNAPASSPPQGGSSSSTSPRKSHSSLYSGTSANSSKASIHSVVFSETDEPPPATQTTVATSFREKPSRLGLQRQSSQDSFVPSSADIQALEESFSKYAEDFSRTDDEPEPDSTPRVVGPRSSSILTAHSNNAAWQDAMNLDDHELAALADGEAVLGDAEHEEEIPRQRGRLAERLQNIWPPFPAWLRGTPLPVAWEVTRIALFCGVDLNEITLKYTPEWKDQTVLRGSLLAHHAFAGKAFPPKSGTDAWSASFSNFRLDNQHVVLSVSIDFNTEKSGPSLYVRPQALKLEQSHRLSRRFGADRFLEALFPSPYSSSVPSYLKDDDDAVEEVKQWLTRQRHCFLGRDWAPFYTKDFGHKAPAKQVHLGPESKPVYKERVYFFAEGGIGFVPPRLAQSLPLKNESLNARTKLTVPRMLGWALELEKNKSQPYLKLFQRIALVLSNTTPTIVFGPNQLRNQEDDIRSPTGEIMNDGVARMSLSVARKLRDILGLSDIPSGIQGRLGCAKGMWIIDVTDNGTEDWIETFPSQRKWDSNWIDEEFRTLEVRKHAAEIRSARFNLQLLPVLEDRAKDKAKMRSMIGELLKTNLANDLESQKVAMNSPVQLRQWVDETSAHRPDRVKNRFVEYLGGMPAEESEAINMLLDGGFDPKKHKYMQEMLYDMQRTKCDTLKKKLNIKVGCSAYIYMVVDFLGVLQPNEVHVAFSTKFQTDDFSGILLHDTNVLVARSPAHFPSDIQKVRAVFKPELHMLRDVIVFPSTGDSPLADKLSGGDYDGDLAWVCWDPRIVDNFANADIPLKPDLMDWGFMRKNKEQFGTLGVAGDMTSAVSEMIDRSFAFNLCESLLGRCTNYKERLCYLRNSVRDEVAVILSTLLSNLVDQAKQGIEFTVKDWNSLLREVLYQPPTLAEPAYKGDNWPNPKRPPTHIIDYLKFDIAKPAIDKELKALHYAMNPSKDKGKGKETAFSRGLQALGAHDEVPEAHYWDEDLVLYYKEWTDMARSSRSVKSLLQALQNDIADVEKLWRTTMVTDTPFPDKVRAVHEQWCAIRPRIDGHRAMHEGSKTVRMLSQLPLADGEVSQWALLRASVAFNLCHRRSHKFVWRMAGRQLQWIKAMRTCRAGDASAPVVVVPRMYAALRPDRKYVQQVVARDEGTGSDYLEGGEVVVDEEEEDDA